MFAWLKNLFSAKTSPNEIKWEDLVSGDLVRVYLKDPKKVGIISDTVTLTYQRLDHEDISKRYVDGFVICTTRIGTRPANIDTLELNVVKKSGQQTRLITYLLLREEVERITLFGDINEGKSPK